jgi:hypothetical protein
VDDLTTRLLAAIEETEYLAQQADHGPWEVRDEEYDTYVIPVDHPRPIVASLELLPNGWHIARHDPEAVLRRCAADRKIVERHGVEARTGYEPDDDDTPHAYGSISRACKECGSSDLAVRSPCKTLVLVAEGYGITEETGNA